jgi:hypothetical protein
MVDASVPVKMGLLHGIYTVNIISRSDAVDAILGNSRQ